MGLNKAYEQLQMRNDDGSTGISYNPTIKELEYQDADAEFNRNMAKGAGDFMSHRGFRRIDVNPFSGDDSNFGEKEPVETLDRAFDLAYHSSANIVAIHVVDSSQSTQATLRNPTEIYGQQVFVNGDGNTELRFENRVDVYAGGLHFQKYSPKRENQDINIDVATGVFIQPVAGCKVTMGGFYDARIFPTVDNFAMFRFHYDRAPGPVFLHGGRRDRILCGSSNRHGTKSGCRLVTRRLTNVELQWNPGGGSIYENIDTTTGVNRLD